MIFISKDICEQFLSAQLILIILMLWMDEVPRAFAISDIQSSPIGDERSSVRQLCQKQHDLWK